MRYWIAALLGAGLAAAHAQDRVSPERGLADLTLEQLANVIVSSPSRRNEPLSRVPASVYVITGDDIRRSGATSLPEALRLAPNLQVARVDSSQYAITARGFNSTIANKLLVLIDGRTVYTPLFAGTFWDAQDVLLEDIHRIEVISGPGATLWGANAVNGVINVITKPAVMTRGTLASAGAGTQERLVGARHGGRLESGHYRLYAKALQRDNTWLPGGEPIRDQAERAQAGFRADWRRAEGELTLQGDLYAAEIDQVPQARELDGANLLARWTRAFDGGGALRVQGYFDRTRREHPQTFAEDLDTYDLEFQHALAPLGRHRLMWGAGMRRHEDRITNSAALAFIPTQRTMNDAHVFVQDEIALTGTLDLTLGAKSERNSFTGTEFLPSARLAWQAAAPLLVWTAYSRAVRAPSRIDRDFFVPGEPPFVLAGGPSFRSEVSDVLELGVRAQASPRLSFSVTAFHHDYAQLRTIAPGSAGAVVANDLEGQANGVEAWGSWRGADWWRIDAGIVRLKQSLGLVPGAVNLQSPSAIGSDPDGWGKLRAAFDLGNATELDFMLRHYGGLENREVPSYTALDARIGWHPRRDLELSLLLTNLLDDAHVEWGPGAELERSAFFQVRLRLP
ncbi:MAG TPA: TonB-dependent receptor [Burkholderiales bacterium]|nr:TonB-dependent receptor [Burkholderiales bacterium]